MSCFYRCVCVSGVLIEAIRRRDRVTRLNSEGVLSLSGSSHKELLYRKLSRAIKSFLIYNASFRNTSMP